MKISRRLRLYYLKFSRLRGSPQELALGMALGLFAGGLPIVPFQTALAVGLAFAFRASKITAALGTWVSNPANWYFLYFYSYKLGASILGLSERDPVFRTIMEAIHQRQDALHIVSLFMQAGAGMIASFLTGGFIIGLLFAVPGYFIFLKFFATFQRLRRQRREKRTSRQEGS